MQIFSSGDKTEGKRWKKKAKGAYGEKQQHQQGKGLVWIPRTSSHRLPKAAARADTCKGQAARGANSSGIFNQFNIIPDMNRMKTFPAKHEAPAPLGTSALPRHPATEGRNPGSCTGDYPTLALMQKKRVVRAEAGRRELAAGCRRANRRPVTASPQQTRRKE